MNGEHERIIRTDKVRGYRKHVAKEYRIKYDPVTAQVTTLRMKGLERDAVRSIREKLKLTQKQFAERLNVDECTVSC